MNHRLVHPEPQENCFGCHLLTVQFGTASEEATVVNSREKRWDRDMPAYKRLRKNGLQPKAIDGSADLEGRATERFEIEYGHIVPPEDRDRVKEGIAAVREMQDQ